MKKSVDSILKSSIELFNEKGIYHVSNREIASNAGISLSTLNYHFKSKNDIIVAATYSLFEELSDLINNQKEKLLQGFAYAVLPDYLRLQIEHRFFYFNFFYLMTDFPKIKNSYMRMVDNGEKIFQSMIYSSIGMGYIKKETLESDERVKLIWNDLFLKDHFLIQHIFIKGEEKEYLSKSYHRTAHLLSPYLTENGKELIAKNAPQEYYSCGH